MAVNVRWLAHSTTFRGLARIVLFVIPLLAWFAFIAVGGRIDINFNL